MNAEDRLDRATAFERGFRSVRVAAGFDQAVSFAFAPGGRIFVTEKTGRVRLVRNGQLRPEPFADLSAEVNAAHDRGLLGLAVHPEFPHVPHIFVSYVYDPPETMAGAGPGGPDGDGARASRVLRLEADPASDYERVRPGSAVVLLGGSADAEHIGRLDVRNGYDPPACGQRGAYVRDCLPADEASHTVGTLAFGPDGALYVGNGDGCDFVQARPSCTRALDVDSLSGKILRIDPRTGDGLPDNPFVDGDLTSNRAKVYQLGLRNPFRFAFDFPTGALYVGDVGWNEWEEIDRAGPGASFGWPCYEGGHATALEQPAYAPTPRCAELRASGQVTTNAYYAYSHWESGVRQGSAVLVGGVYRGTRYPQAYRGALFYGDVDRQQLRFLSFDSKGEIASSQVFAERVGSVTQIAPDPETGDLHMLLLRGTPERLESALERIEFTGYGSGPAPGKLYTIRSADERCVEAIASDESAPGLALASCASLSAQRWLLESGGEERYAMRSESLGLRFTASDESAALARVMLREANEEPAQLLYLVPQDDGYRIVSEPTQRCVAARDDDLVLATCASGPAQVFRIASEANRAPVLALPPTQSHGVGATVQLALGASDPEGGELTYFASGLPRGLALDPQSGLVVGSLNLPGAYTVRVRVSDGELTVSGSFDWQVKDDQLPQPTIEAPLEGRRFAAGDLVEFAGSARDFTGAPIPVEQLTWSLVSHHNNHTHPGAFASLLGRMGTLRYDDHGDNTALELCLEASDAAARIGRTCRILFPSTVEYTLDTVPSGLELPWEGVLLRTPFTVQTHVGGTRDLIAPLTQDGQRFVAWSDGGAAAHDITIASTPTRLVATYEATPPAGQ